MLKAFRQKGITKKVLWVVAGIIIVSFAFGFGASQYTEAFSLLQPAGKVFGKTISLKDYQRHYRNAYDQAVMMHGANIEKLLPFLDMDNETWTRILLVKAAETRGIKAADVEVVQYIGSIPFFQRNGEFDKRLYANMVKNIFRRDAREFEEGLRDQIKIMKLFAPHLKAINFSKEDLRKEYERRNQKMQVSYVLFDPNTFSKNITTDEKELQAYYAAHQNDLLEPEAVNIQLITLSSSEKSADAQAEADRIQEQWIAGAEPASLAKTNNASFRETGFFTMNNPAADISWSFDLIQQVFTAKPNTVLAPVKNDLGYQIIRIAGKNPSFTPEFAKIKDKITAAIVHEKSTQAAAEQASQLYTTISEKLKNGREFSAVVQELGLTVKQTPFFGMGEYIPEIGLSDDFTSAAFLLNQDNRLSSTVLTPRGPAILYWKATQPVDEKKFEEMKEDFEASLHNEERVRVMNEVIQTLREKAKLEDYLKKIDDKQKNAMEKLRVK